MLEPINRSSEAQRRSRRRRNRRSQPTPAVDQRLDPRSRRYPNETVGQPGEQTGAGRGSTADIRSSRSGDRSGKAAPQPGMRRTSRMNGLGTEPAHGRQNRAGVQGVPGQRPESAQTVPQRRQHQSTAAQPRRTRQVRKKRAPRPISPLTHGIRMLILGVGIWAIAGTALSIWEPTMRSSAQANHAGTNQVQQASALTAAGGMNPSAPINAGLKSGQEMTALSSKILPLTKDLKDLTPGVFLTDLDSGDYFSLNGASTFSAASTIKVPILVAFFQDIDAGKIRLDEELTMQEKDVATGSGDMQYAEVGSKYSALEVATNMIVISDNTATNMLIRRLGGIEAVNQRFKQWGLQQTLIQNVLPDLEGTNTTSPKELSALMAVLSQGELLSMKSRDRALEIMRQTVTDTLLPTSLRPGATISHKTGDIGSLVGDTGLIDMPSGRRYAITAMVKRPHNDDRAQELIRQIAAVVYDDLAQPTGTAANALNRATQGNQPGASPMPNTSLPGSPEAGTVPTTAPNAATP
ncbi:MAG TPA: serine hydrolase [Trichocoleus sp.]